MNNDKELLEYNCSLENNISGELLLFRTLWNNSNDNMFIVSVDENGEFFSEATNATLEKTFHLKAHQKDGERLKDICCV